MEFLNRKTDISNIFDLELPELFRLILTKIDGGIEYLTQFKIINLRPPEKHSLVQCNFRRTLDISENQNVYLARLSFGPKKKKFIDTQHSAFKYQKNVKNKTVSMQFITILLFDFSLCVTLQNDQFLNRSSDKKRSSNFV